MKFQMRINKFISSCGVCSRRNADNLIINGKIEVNNKLITTPGLIIKENDIVKYNGKVLKLKNDKLYFLLNKPVNFISTCFDKKKRKTILDLINIKNKNIYPVGRLDRNTTGLIILTNDGFLTNKLTHPSSNIIKKYTVLLHKQLQKSDENKIKKGIILEDGFFKFDEIIISDDRLNIDVTLHSGRNRIIRRTFEHFGSKIKALDRYYYAGLTKKNLKLGTFKKLTSKEIELLKNL